MAAVPASGELLHVAEVRNAQSGASVRVLGRLVDYDALQDSAVFQDPCPNRQQDCLTVDMSLVTPDDGLKQHALFSVIGDVYFLPQIGSEKNGQAAVRARVLTSMEGVDVDLYASALEIRRKFLQENKLLPTNLKRDRDLASSSSQDMSSRTKIRPSDVGGADDANAKSNVNSDTGDNNSDIVVLD